MILEPDFEKIILNKCNWSEKQLNFFGTLIYNVENKGYEMEYEKLSNLINTENFIEKDLFVVSKEKNNYILNKEQLNKFLENGKLSEQKYFVAKNEMENYIKEIGFMKTPWLANENKKFKNLSIKDFISKDWLNDLKNNKNEFIVLEKQEFNQLGYVFKKNNGDFLIEPIVFDWIRGNLHDGKFKLDEMIEFVSKRDDVSFLIQENYNSSFELIKCPLKGDEKNMGKIIFDITHHLEDGESLPEENETATIIYYPNHDNQTLIKEIINLGVGDNYVDKNKKIFSVHENLLLNLFNCEQFLKNPIIENLIKRKFKN